MICNLEFRNIPRQLLSQYEIKYFAGSSGCIIPIRHFSYDNKMGISYGGLGSAYGSKYF